MQIFHGQYYNEMINNIFWTGFCKKDRFISISEIEDIINKYGFIYDFKEFSDISISFIISVEEHKINKLFIELNKQISLREFESINSPSINERIVFLNVTFLRGTGNFKVEIPAVPG